MIFSVDLQSLLDKTPKTNDDLKAIGKILFDLCGNAANAQIALKLLNLTTLSADDKHTIVNYKDTNGTTPLMVAARNIFTHYDVINLLVDNGADVDAQCTDSNKGMALNNATWAFRLNHWTSMLDVQDAKLIKIKEAFKGAIMKLITPKNAMHLSADTPKSQLDRLNVSPLMKSPLSVPIAGKSVDVTNLVRDFIKSIMSEVSNKMSYGFDKSSDEMKSTFASKIIASNTAISRVNGDAQCNAACMTACITSFPELICQYACTNVQCKGAVIAPAPVAAAPVAAAPVAGAPTAGATPGTPGTPGGSMPEGS